MVPQAQAAVAAEVRRAATPQEFARLLLLTEDLVYVDLLKGTGWGRRRNWCKDQLEACRTLAQVSPPPPPPLSPPHPHYVCRTPHTTPTFCK